MKRHLPQRESPSHAARNRHAPVHVHGGYLVSDRGAVLRRPAAGLSGNGSARQVARRENDTRHDRRAQQRVPAEVQFADVLGLSLAMGRQRHTLRDLLSGTGFGVRRFDPYARAPLPLVVSLAPARRAPAS